MPSFAFKTSVSMRSGWSILYMKIFLYILLLAVAINLNASENPAVYGDIPDYGEKYLSPDFVKINKDRVFVTARTSDELIILNKGKIERRVQLGGHPSGVAITKDVKFAFVTIAHPDGKLLKINVANGKILSKVDAGHMPRAVELSPDMKRVYVANQFENLVRAFDSSNLKELASGKVVRDAFSIAPTPDGKKLFVLNQLPESKGGLYEENIAAAVSVLDAKTLKNIAKIDLPNGSINAQEIVVSPDGSFAYCTHVVARFNVPTTQVERGWINTNAVSVIDVQKNELLATVLLDDIELGAANPYGLTIAQNGRSLVVTHSGTHEVSVIDRKKLDSRIADLFAKSTNRAQTFEDICNDLAFLSGIRKRVALNGFGPRHLAAIGDTLYVGMYYSDTLNKINLSNFSIEKISLGGNEKLNEIRKGDLYYHDASLCFQKWLSCVTCHTEVRSDALNWDLLNDGMGNPKQSKSMLFAHFTPPTMITGVRKTAELCVRKGIQYIQFTRRPEEDAKAIDEYMKSLLPVRSPHLIGGKMTESQERGEMLFEEAKCSHCHSGKYLTDMKSHDVGSGLEEYVGFAFDTPTLKEVWRSAPYLYDGRARTIFDMLKKFNKGNKHGITSNLSDDDLRDLEAYVLTL